MLLRTLGTFELVAPGADGQLARLLPGQKPLALVAYLAFSPGRRATRERLTDLLWRNVEPERARRTLRQTLWSIRQRLGEDAVVSEGEALVLALPLDTDVTRFEQAIRAGELEAAWALYGGPFIADFASAGSVGFESWCDTLRDRLQLQWLGLGASLVSRRLQEERTQDAALIARRLRDTAPDQLGFWRMELRAWLAAGARVEALAVAQSLERFAQEEGLSLDAETLGVITRARAGGVEPLAGVERRPRPELVGRERAFASMLQAWRGIGEAHGGRVVVVRGSAGIGKTRLLEEMADRIRQSAGQVVVARARPADRDLSFSLVAAIVEALAALPGALGISSASAAVLVDVAPALSSTFRGATAGGGGADELPRLRALATLELITSIAEELPLLLLVDDLHWADDASRQLLASLADRLTGTPVLLVVASRMTGRSWAVPEGAVYVDLAPLAIEHLESLLTSMATGEETMLRSLAELLQEVAGGNPMLALAALDFALERRVLRIEQDAWTCRSLEELRRLIGSGGVLEKLLADLPAGGLAMLAALALCGGALDEEVLVAAAADLSDADLLPLLATRGLVSRSTIGWEIAHDRMVDAVLAVVTPAELQQIRIRTGRALLHGGQVNARQLQLAGRLLADGGDPEARQLFLRWLLMQRNARHWRAPAHAAALFLGDAAHPEQVEQLASTVSRASRLWWGYPTVTRVALAMVLLGVGMGAVLSGARVLEASAVRMVITPPATNQGFYGDLASGPTAVPPLVVDFVDARGRLSRRAPSRVRLQLLVERGQVTLTGPLEQPVTHGRAVFTGLEMRGAGVYQLEVMAEGLPAARTTRLFSMAGNRVQDILQVQLVAGQINGQAVDSVRREVHVRGGETLDGMITVRTTSTERYASSLLGAIGLWGDRRSNFLTLRATQSLGEQAAATALKDAVDGRTTLQAPDRPGRYPLLLVMRAETEMRFVASGTNWVFETPRWNDGDDLADLPPAAVAQLRTEGFTPWRRIERRIETGQAYQASFMLIGTVIDIVVDP